VIRWPGWVLVTLGAAYLASNACEPVPLGDGPRLQGVKATASDIMVPGLEALEADAHALVAAIETGGREEAQATWRAARVAYKRIEPLGIGPVVDDRIGPRLDSPVDPARVLALAETATLTAEGLDELGANRLGFHALEVLLFGDPALWSSPRTHRLASGLAAVLAADITRLRGLWTDGYAVRFSRIAQPDSVYATTGAAIDALVNVLVTQTEKMFDKRLGAPLGHESGGVVDPARAESPLSDASIDDLVANIDGIEQVYGEALSALVTPALDQRVRAAFATARARLLAIRRPFAVALVDETATVESAWAAVRALWVILRTEVVGATGAVLKFDSNDGD